jgi:NTE family protein
MFLVVFFNGCASYRATNEPLKKWDPDYGYRPKQMEAKRPMGDVLMVLAFSGGGTRAAAMSYGVLQELRDTRIVMDGKEKRLLDEVDYITSVSGGSFTAAYYGLFGDRTFEDFEERFLRRNIQGEIVLQMLRPFNWIRLASPFFDRSEFAIRIYDEEIFDGATFADLEAADGPMIYINATDLGAGSRFTFFQPQFDLICSDLSKFKVARAAAASSAVPALLSPIVIRSYAGECEFERPDWLEEALNSRHGSMRRFQNARIVQSYLDGKRKFIHLADGGLADNIGLRGLLDNIILVGGIRKRFEQLGAVHPSHIVILVVNAEVWPDQQFSLKPNAPSLFTLMSVVSGVQIYSYNFETLELMRESLKNWVHEIPADQQGRKVKTYLAEISFDTIADPKERSYFNGLPTSFSLEDEEVDRLIEIGRRLLRESPEFQKLLTDLNANSGKNLNKNS